MNQAPKKKGLASKTVNGLEYSKGYTGPPDSPFGKAEWRPIPAPITPKEVVALLGIETSEQDYIAAFSVPSFFWNGCDPDKPKALQVMTQGAVFVLEPKEDDAFVARCKFYSPGPENTAAAILDRLRVHSFFSR